MGAARSWTVTRGRGCPRERGVPAIPRGLSRAEQCLGAPRLAGRRAVLVQLTDSVGRVLVNACFFPLGSPE